MVVITALALLVFVICAVVFINKVFAYDPDKHVCTDSVRACKGMSGEELKQFYAGEIEQECYDKCLDWRPKKESDLQSNTSTQCEMHIGNSTCSISGVSRCPDGFNEFCYQVADFINKSYVPFSDHYLNESEIKELYLQNETPIIEVIEVE